MNRVCCLYRVSTEKQIQGGLAMQKQACRAFVEDNGWTIVKEFTEEGVSGLRDARRRTVLIQILEMAARKQFDVLLVFMLDRIGRRHDDTFFFAEQLSALGIKIWSVIERQQQFDSHLDKLQNFIHYWQAESESLATSARVKAKMNQIAEEGRFRGGNVPYGYRLVHKGRVNKKGHNVYDVEVDPNKTEIVNKIFSLYIDEHYGVAKIAKYLNENGILSNTGKPWHPDRIYNLIKNPMYRGIIRNGGTKSDVVSELQIISKTRFEQAQSILDGKKKDAELHDPERYSEIFRGRVYCGHCNCIMSVRTTSTKYTAKNSEIKIYRGRSYFCPQRQQCGNISHNAKNIDEDVIIKTIAKIKDSISHMAKAISTPDLNRKTSQLDLKVKEADEAVVQAKKERKEICDLIGEAIVAQDIKGYNLLENQLKQADIKLNCAQEALDLAEYELYVTKQDRTRLKRDVKELKTQLNHFNDMEKTRQEEFAASLVERVGLFRNGNVKIEWVEAMQWL